MSGILFRSLLVVTVAAAIPIGPCWAQTAPSIQITSLPSYGSSPGWVSGRVIGVAASGFNIAALVFVPGLGFYSKPFCSPTTTPLAADGTFNVLLTTGGIDPYATMIALLVV